MKSTLFLAAGSLAVAACASPPAGPRADLSPSTLQTRSTGTDLPAGLNDPRRLPRLDGRAILTPIPTTPEGQPAPTPIPPADPSEEPRTGPITPR